MDQKQIGRFIKTKRNEKNLTQQELANQLNVTDKAISNWETGRRLPDISLLVDLSKKLDISIQDLLNGEELSSEQSQIKCDENIKDTIEIANKKIKKNKKLYSLIILGIVLLFVLIFFITRYPKESSFEIIQNSNYADKVVTLKIKDEIDTKYFNKEIVFNTNLSIKDNELFVLEDDYNKNNKMSNIITIESNHLFDKLTQHLCIVSINDDKQQITINATFQLDYLFLNKRDFFETKYIYEYKIVDDSKLKLKLIEEKEWINPQYPTYK